MTTARGCPAPGRRGFSLTELLVALSILALLAGLALSAWVRTTEAASLRQAQIQVAAVLRDVVARVNTTGPLAVATTTAEAMFSAGSGTVGEYVDTGAGWVAVPASPAAPLTLPAGITVASSTFAGGTAQAWQGESDTGTFEQIPVQATAGSVTLQSAHGMTATIHLTLGGTVWY